MKKFAAASELLPLRLQLLNVDDHLHDYYDMMSHVDTTVFSTKRPHVSIDETRMLILSTVPTEEDPWRNVYAIMLDLDLSKEKTSMYEANRAFKMIGVIGTPRMGEIAYKLHPDYWGKGYMSEALRMFLNVYWTTRENQDENVIWALVDPENIGSTKVMTKAGFTKSRLFPDHYIRGINLESRKKSSLQAFYTCRPGTTPATTPVFGRNSEASVPELSKENHEKLTASIKDMLSVSGNAVKPA